MPFLIQDSNIAENLLPLTFARPVEDFRVGILTIKDKWERLLACPLRSFVSATNMEEQSKDTFVFSHILPNPTLAKEILALEEGEQLVDRETTLSFCGSVKRWAKDQSSFKSVQSSVPSEKIQYPFDLFKLNKSQLQSDYRLITKGRVSAQLKKSNRYSGAEYIFIEGTAQVNFSTLIANHENPIYIGHNAIVMENTLLKDGVAICQGAHIKPNTVVCNGSTIGDFSKVGGEVSNSIFFSYSNKAHHGFLGNSVIGSWCNLGAGTSCSNLKNNYSSISLWSYPLKCFVRHKATLFCGLIMGDHAKTGINTTFNTATSVGFSSSILSGKIPPKYIPSFIWDDGNKKSEYQFDKSLETASQMMNRRGISMKAEDRDIFKKNFIETQADRTTFLKTHTLK